MPKVTFVQDRITLDVPVGTTVQSAVEMANASLPFGCRHGSCGTCRCLIIEGMENLSKMGPIEWDLFESLTSVYPNERLGCQLIINGDVKIQS